MRDGRWSCGGRPSRCWRRCRCWRCCSCRSSSGRSGANCTTWTRASGSGDHLLAGKRPFLNLPFFLVRLAGYFAVWLLLMRIMRSNSIRQDVSGEARYSFAMRRWSAPGMLLYAITFSFAAIDWIMTLDYRWFSTVFGVYVWSGSVVGSLALLILIVVALARGAAEWPGFLGSPARSGQAAVRLFGLLGVHRVLAVLPDLVREHPRRDDLVPASVDGHGGGGAGGQVVDHQRAAAGGAFPFAV